jgi:hypothetical protein
MSKKSRKDKTMYWKEDKSMKMIKKLATRGMAGPLACLALLWVAAIPHAQAATMSLGGQTNAVVGSMSELYSFATPGAGTVTVNSWNMSWDSFVKPLSALSFAVTEGNQVLAQWDGTATQSFTVGGAGTYYAHITGTAASGGLFNNLGAFAFAINFEPSAVPLPASEWMLVTGLFVLLGLARVLKPLRTADGRQAVALMGTATA